MHGAVERCERSLWESSLFFSFGVVSSLAMSDLLVSGTWRYRITVVVQTPEGEVSGSSIWEVSLDPKKVITNVGYDETIRGEAVAIDLGERGYLFALMRGPNREAYMRQVVYWMFPDTGIEKTRVASIEFYNSLKGKSASLPPEYFPLLIHFKDIDNPKSAEIAFESLYRGTKDSKSLRIDRIREIYGEGVEIKNIMIEMTDDTVRFNLHKILRWLVSPEGIRLKEHPIIAKTGGLTYVDFQRGKYDE